MAQLYFLTAWGNCTGQLDMQASPCTELYWCYTSDQQNSAKKKKTAYRQGTTVSNIFQDTDPVILKHRWNITDCDHSCSQSGILISCLMEIHNLCLLLLIPGPKSFFHWWVWDALIITDKHKPPLTAFFPSFNITLIFHLWLLIQSLITNKHSVNVAIIASSPRLDYLWHSSFTITATGKRRSEEVVPVWYERLLDLFPPAKSIWSAACVYVLKYAHVHRCVPCFQSNLRKLKLHLNVMSREMGIKAASSPSCISCIFFNTLNFLLKETLFRWFFRFMGGINTFLNLKTLLTRTNMTRTSFFPLGNSKIKVLS